MIDKPNSSTTLVKIAQRRDELRDVEPVKPGGKPMPPVGEIDEKRVGLRVSWGNLRIMFLLPWLAGLCVGLWWQMDGLRSGWKAYERGTLEYIDASKRLSGEDYFTTTDNEVALRKFRRIDETGRMPLENYMEFRYRDSVGAEQRLQGDIFLAIVFALGIPGLTIAILSFHRKAPLYFDRDRRIAYTWRRGHVWAQRYDALWYYSNSAAMTFILYGYDSQGRFRPRRFVVTPNGGPWFNGEVLYRQVLAFVERFMARGRDAVWPSDWVGRRGVYLFEDHKPENFDDQLTRVLEHIEREQVNEQADALARGWGFEA